MSRGDHGGGLPQPQAWSHIISNLPRLRKSDRRIFHTKASLQKLSAKVSNAGGVPGYPSRGMWGDMGWWPPPHHQALLSPSLQFSARLAEHSKQLVGVQNEYGFALVSATAHLEHYRRVELPAAMQVGAARTPPPLPLPGVPQEASPQCHWEGVQQGGSRWCGDRPDCPGGVRDAPQGDAGSAVGVSHSFSPQALDGDLYERLREHLSAASRTEVETCRATRDWFQGIAEASTRVMAPVPEAAWGRRGRASPSTPRCSPAAGVPGAGPPPLPPGPPCLHPGPGAALPAHRGGGGKGGWGA